jgi:tetratricopeptide (TPR) repeat protein
VSEIKNHIGFRNVELNRVRRCDDIGRELKVERNPSWDHNAAVPRSPKKKKKSRAVAAWTISAIIAAGVAGAAVGIKSKSRRSSPATTNAISSSTVTNAVPAEGTEEALAAWMAGLSNRTDAAELMNDGTALLSSGRVREAVACYQRAVALKPDDEEAHYNLGLAYAKAGQPAVAERHYREALRIFPEYAEAHNNLGNVLTRQKRYAEAVEAFKAALKLQPEYALAHNNLGRALAEQGAPSEGLPHFLEAVRLDTNYLEAHFNLGNSYLNIGRTNDAIRHFDEVVRIRPGFAPAVQALSRLRSTRSN